MAEAVVEPPRHDYFFCHKCNVEFDDVVQDFTCPYCASGFIERLEGDRSLDSVSSGRDDDEEYSDADMSMLEDGTQFEEPQRSIGNPILNDLTMLLSGGRYRNPAAPIHVLYPPMPPRRSENRTLVDQLVWMIGGGRGAGGAVTAGAPFVLVGAPGDYVFGGEGLDAVVTQLLGQLENSGPPPLPTQQIQAIPSDKVTAEQVEANMSCSVCWDNFKLDELVSRLECSHIFHGPCITPWLQLHATCPICRRSLLTGEQQARRGAGAEPAAASATTATTAATPTHTARNTREYIPAPLYVCRRSLLTGEQQARRGAGAEPAAASATTATTAATPTHTARNTREYIPAPLYVCRRSLLTGEQQARRGAGAEPAAASATTATTAATPTHTARNTREYIPAPLYVCRRSLLTGEQQARRGAGAEPAAASATTATTAATPTHTARNTREYIPAPLYVCRRSLLTGEQQARRGAGAEPAAASATTATTAATPTHTARNTREYIPAPLYVCRRSLLTGEQQARRGAGAEPAAASATTATTAATPTHTARNTREYIPAPLYVCRRSLLTGEQQARRGAGAEPAAASATTATTAATPTHTARNTREYIPAPLYVCRRSLLTGEQQARRGAGAEPAAASATTATTAATPTHTARNTREYIPAPLYVCRRSLLTGEQQARRGAGAEPAAASATTATTAATPTHTARNTREYIPAPLYVCRRSLLTGEQQARRGAGAEPAAASATTATTAATPTHTARNTREYIPAPLYVCRRSLLTGEQQARRGAGAEPAAASATTATTAATPTHTARNTREYIPAPLYVCRRSLLTGEQQARRGAGAEPAAASATTATTAATPTHTARNTREYIPAPLYVCRRSLLTGEQQARRGAGAEPAAASATTATTAATPTHTARNTREYIPAPLYVCRRSLLTGEQQARRGAGAEPAAASATTATTAATPTHTARNTREYIPAPLYVCRRSLLTGEQQARRGAGAEPAAASATTATTAATPTHTARNTREYIPAPLYVCRRSLLTGEQQARRGAGAEPAAASATTATTAATPTHTARNTREYIPAPLYVCRRSLLTGEQQARRGAGAEPAAASATTATTAATPTHTARNTREYIPAPLYVCRRSLLTGEQQARRGAGAEPAAASATTATTAATPTHTARNTPTYSRVVVRRLGPRRRRGAPPASDSSSGSGAGLWSHLTSQLASASASASASPSASTVSSSDRDNMYMDIDYD